MHFPDTDPRWKGCDSLQFLRHACDLAAQAGFQIVNVDSTVILERPKLKDYRLAIRESLAKTMDLDVERVSVKFKTAEGVGPVGEGKSAEAQAVVLLEERNSAGLARGINATPRKDTTRPRQPRRASAWRPAGCPDKPCW